MYRTNHEKLRQTGLLVQYRESSTGGEMCEWEDGGPYCCHEDEHTMLDVLCAYRPSSEKEPGLTNPVSCCIISEIH